MKYLALLGVLIAAGCSKEPQPAAAAAPEPAKPQASSALTPDNTAPPAQEDAAMTEDRIGAKFYPGARVVTGGDTSDVLSANLETPDAIEKVVAFYQKEMPNLTLSGDPSNTMFEGMV